MPALSSPCDNAGFFMLLFFARYDRLVAGFYRSLMKIQNFIIFLLFAVFFSVGLSAVSLSLVCGELFDWYSNKVSLTEAEQTLLRLQSLNEDYDVLLAQLKEDPGLLKRAAPAALGRRAAEDANTAYPRFTPDQLEAARIALSGKSESSESPIPLWLCKSQLQPVRRFVLFFAGACLILISFVCFRPPGKLPEAQ